MHNLRYIHYCFQVIIKQETPASDDNEGSVSVECSPQYSHQGPTQTHEVVTPSDSPIVQHTMHLYSLEAVTFQQV